MALNLFAQTFVDDFNSGNQESTIVLLCILIAFILADQIFICLGNLKNQMKFTRMKEAKSDSNNS